MSGEDANQAADRAAFALLGEVIGASNAAGWDDARYEATRAAFAAPGLNPGPPSPWDAYVYGVIHGLHALAQWAFAGDPDGFLAAAGFPTAEAGRAALLAEQDAEAAKPLPPACPSHHWQGYPKCVLLTGHNLPHQGWDPMEERRLTWGDPA